MKPLFRFVCIALVIAVGVGAVPRSYAQNPNSQNRELRKAEKRREKASKKYAKAQKKAEKKMLKTERKNSKRYANPAYRPPALPTH